MLPINDLNQKIHNSRAPILAAVEQVLDSGWVVLGPEVKKFENAFAKYLGANHAIGLANGTDAIELGLRALGVQAGDCVATVANAGMYTTTAIRAIGANPLYMDVNLETRLVTLADVNLAINAGAQAIVATHLYGLTIPVISEIAQMCKEKNIPLLEDCAQAHGAELNEKKAGTFGDAAAFSFYPTKNLGALGDGGAVVSNHPKVAENLYQLRQYGWSEKYSAQLDGGRNSRLDEIQAALLSVFLPQLDEENSRRRQIATRYSTTIDNPNVVTPKVYGAEYVAHLYVICSKNQQGLRAYLRSKEIASEVHYPIPDYRQPVLGENHAFEPLENTEQLAAEILTLPCHPHMTLSETDRVITAINEWQP